MQQKKYLTVPQAAERLHVSRRLVYKMVNQTGELRGKKIAGSIRIDAQSVEELWARSDITPTEPAAPTNPDSAYQMLRPKR